MQLTHTKKCCDNPVIVDRGYYLECTNCECCCTNAGQDDGGKTCWQHHNCANGDCTHTDGSDD